ncbi:chorismate mutase [Paenibacillus sp. FSL H8-0548]|uniref:chorismate mutase n=1 Tax=Paenibacillus sp. FSL H8-0548 TaxID=1920422 RepID=UPI00096FBF60|nr:chorismate mutase [Paenibacillus sp. FSL H8-0548]OMF27157.1 chorismate mutase [Paenibacillus sp. FSL H8-0548]
MEASRLDELRQGIDHLDQQIISLLAKRFQLTEEVGIYKASNKLAAQDSSREAEQFDKIEGLAASCGLNPQYASAIYRRLMDVVITRHIEIENGRKD